MTIPEALLLGLIQGLTEFLPISSSGHLEIGKAILNIQADADLTFIVLVHGATVLSTIVVFWNDLQTLTKDVFKFRWNDSTRYVAMLLLSMVPVGLTGLFLKEQVESYFTGNVMFVGFMLLLTAVLLLSAHYLGKGSRVIGFRDALIIGIAQAIAVLPGLSRSGATIATGLMIGNSKTDLTKFSFLMVLLPIIGANILEIKKLSAIDQTELMPLLAGFIVAFVAGLFACKWMIAIVRNSNLIYFSVYCFIAGAIAILCGL